MKKFNQPKELPRSLGPVREKIHEVIFEADTRSGFVFDVSLLVVIVLSVIIVCLDSVQELSEKYEGLFRILEWIFTILFTAEYALRLYCVRRPWRYVISFYGIIDLLSFLPSYLLLFISGAPSFAVIRALRLLRVFRVFKLIYLLGEAEEMGQAIVNARAKVLVFFGFVMIAVCIAGALMYEIESLGRESENFRNIPESIYWAIVTMTTVGYGDIVPQTVLGKIVASLLILLGYSMIIVPTGFVSAEFIKAKEHVTTINCQTCASEGHDLDAVYCKYCGEEL